MKTIQPPFVLKGSKLHHKDGVLDLSKLTKTQRQGMMALAKRGKVQINGTAEREEA